MGQEGQMMGRGEGKGEDKRGFQPFAHYKEIGALFSLTALREETKSFKHRFRHDTDESVRQWRLPQPSLPPHTSSFCWKDRPFLSFHLLFELEPRPSSSLLQNYTTSSLSYWIINLLLMLLERLGLLRSAWWKFFFVHSFLAGEHAPNMNIANA